MRFGILGTLLVVDGAGRSITVSAARQRTVLAVLLLHADRPVSFEALADFVWDGVPPAGSATTLRNHVMRLRRTLGDEIAARIVTRDPGYVFELGDAQVDVLRFETLCREAGAALRTGAWGDASASAGDALRLWRGDALSDVSSTALREQCVARLEQLRVQAFEDRVEADLHLERHHELLAELRDLTAQYPLRERFHAQLMRALTRVGRQAEALEAYRNLRRTLVDELGVEPGPEVRALHERILMGEDGDDGERVEAQVPRQLPCGARQFVGRAEELAALGALLDKVDHRKDAGNAVVISAIGGMGGIGKTAFALQAAHRFAARFPDGQLFIDLHAYTQGCVPRSPADALEALLRALGVAPRQLPDDVEQRATLFRQRLAGTRTLIVLDNAADEAQVRPLLPGDSQCLVIITSRRRFKGLDDAYPISLDVLPQADAVALLRAGAGREYDSGDETVLGEIAELCGRLPLALRIAAALLRHRSTWTVRHLADLLRDREQRLGALDDGERHLGALLDLSYQSLDEQHRCLFRRLGLIPGPDFDAYVTAALIDADPRIAVRTLDELVDHNLVTAQESGRYRLHDLLRLQARTLVEQEPSEVRVAALDRLLDYYQHTAGQAEILAARYPRPAPSCPAPAYAFAMSDATTAWAWLRAERPNLLAALQHATTQIDERRVISLTAGMAALLRADGPWTLAITLHTDAAAIADRLADRRSQAYALTDLGALKMFTGDYPGATNDQERALELFRHVADPAGEAGALSELGRLRMLTGDNSAATHDLQRALDLFQESGEASGQATVLSFFGQLRRATGDYPGAAQDQQEALRLFRLLGNEYGQAAALTWLSDVRRATGDHAGATRDLREALRLFRRLDDRNGQAMALTWLGEAKRAAEDYPGAARELREALRLFRELGERNGQGIALTWLGATRRAIGELADAKSDLEAALELFRLLRARNNEVVALNHYAAVIAALGDKQQALGLYEEALQKARDTNKRDEQANALEGAGECRLCTGDTGTGMANLEQALEMFESLAMSPDVSRVQARLAGV